MNFQEEYIQQYLSRVENPDTVMIGDVGAFEKLSLESAFRDAGLNTSHCATMAGVWSNVVHLHCRYPFQVYLRFRDALLSLPDGSFRDGIRARFLVALEVDDFPNS